jgi:RNA polymerase sigma-70 factor (ECF subfamily)
VSSAVLALGATDLAAQEPADPDEVLVRRFLRDRDPAAFAALARRHEAPVFRLVASILGPGHEADAEDVAQEIFIHVYHRLSSFRFRSRFSTWLYRVAYRKAIDEKRRSRYQRPHLQESVLATHPSDGDSLSGAIERQEASRLRRWVDELPEPQRTAVVLFYWSEASVKEIGEVLGAKPVTVRSWLHRARALLAKRLQEEAS